MTILVTGGAGFIGSNFVLDWLAAGGETVVNLDKLTYAGNRENLASLEGNNRHHFVAGGIEDEALTGGLLSRHEVRAVVNFAAESHVDRSISGPGAFIETNVVGTFRLLEAVRGYWSGLPAAEAAEFRFLHVSTDEVYGTLEPDEPPFSEKNAYRPNSPYAASKTGADVLVRAYHVTYDLPAVITRTCNNYGPYQFPEKFIPLMIVNALRGEPLPIYGDGLYVREWLHVEDHCRALALVLAKGRPGAVYNIGSGEERANIDVAREILRLTGQPETLLRHVKDRPGHDRRYALDHAKIRGDLGWAPAIPFAAGLRHAVEWYRRNETWWQEILSGEYRAYYARQYGEDTA